MNPIVVYEIRRIVRNRLVLGALCAYLVLMIVTVGEVFHEWTASGLIHVYGDGPGSMLATLLLERLFLASGGFVILYSVAMTLQESLAEELIFCTDIDWRKYLWGKALVAAILTLLFYSMTLPFLTLAWMMRGVDLRFLLSLPVCFLVTQTVNFYLMAAFIRCRTISDGVYALGGLLFAFPLFLFVAVLMYAFFNGEFMHQPAAWGTVYAWTIVHAICTSLVVADKVQDDLWRGVPAHRRMTIVFVTGWCIMMLTVFIAGLAVGLAGF